MSRSLTDLITLIEPYADRVYYKPLSASEINSIEAALQIPIPTLFREYLLKVGLGQDFLQFEFLQLFERQAEFRDGVTSLHEILGPEAIGLFPIGHDGAGNIFALRSDQPEMLLADHEAQTLIEDAFFPVILESAFIEAVARLPVALPNHRKSWHIQFTFAESDFDEIIAAINGIAPVAKVAKVWSNFETSAANVTSSERSFDINGIQHTMSRLEYAGWKYPMFSFDRQESLKLAESQWLTPRLDAIFQKLPGYKLVDYGILPSDLL